MVAHGAPAPRHVHVRRHLVAHLEPAGGEHAVVAEHLGLDLLGIGDREGAARRDQLARVTHLPAPLGVERRLIEDHDGGVARGDARHRGSFPVDRGDPGSVERQRVVAAEFRGAPGVFHSRFHFELARRARALALALHRRLEACMVDHDAALARHVGGEVHGKPEGIVELEHGFPVEHAILAMQRGFQDLHAVLERLGETFLLRLEDLRDALLRLRQLGIGIAHRRGQVRDEAVEKRLLLSELVAVADRPPDDAAEHVAASLVPGNDAVPIETHRRDGSR